MPRNGAGLMVLDFSWPDDDANDIPIQSDRMQAQEQDIADALTASIATDGQTPPTANLPMAGFKHTGVAAGTAPDDYVRVDQIQKGTLNSFTATGTDTYAITPSPIVAAYVLYQSWRVLFTNGNTGAATLNVNGVGAKAITKRGAVALVAGDIPAGAVADVVYDGTQFQLLSVVVEPNFFTATGTDTYAVTAAPVLTAYTAGRTYKVLFTNANTGAATINFNSLGAKAITKNGTTALGAGDIPTGAIVQITYDGTQFQASIPGASVALGLASGATKTGSFTAVANTRYPCPFTANATITGPSSASVGDIMVFGIGGGFLTLFDPNGLKVNGSANVLALGTDELPLMMMYVSAARGWI